MSPATNGYSRHSKPFRLSNALSNVGNTRLIVLVFLLGAGFGKLYADLTAEECALCLCGQKSSLPLSTPISQELEVTPSGDQSRRNDVGWKNIQIFYGQVQDAPKKNKMWYSQVGQDKVVFDLFRNKRDGYFIDLAANDALWLSNSYGLERFHGWKGLCVEPNPKYIFDHARYRTCQFVGAIVGDKRMQEIKFSYRAEYGGISMPGMFNGNFLWSKFGITAYTVPLLEILERFSTPKEIDYLSLDVEGAEYMIMKGFPFDSYRIKAMTVELPSDELKSLLSAHGYELVAQFTSWETLWIHKDFKESLDLGAIPKNKRLKGYKGY